MRCRLLCCRVAAAFLGRLRTEASSSSAAVSLSSINLATWSAVPRSGSIIGTRRSGSRPTSNTIESQLAATMSSAPLRAGTGPGSRPGWSVGGSVIARIDVVVGRRGVSSPTRAARHLLGPQVVVLQVDAPSAGRRPGARPWRSAIAVDEALLGHPVDRRRRRSSRSCSSPVEHALPSGAARRRRPPRRRGSRPWLALVLAGPLEQPPLDLERRRPPAVAQQRSCASASGRG